MELFDVILPENILKWGIQAFLVYEMDL